MRVRQQVIGSKRVRRATARQRQVAALAGSAVIVLFVGLWLAQRVGFDFGLLFPPCGVKQKWGVPCLTCGMTTAVLAFARGAILTSFYAQPAAAFLCSMLVIGAFFAFLTAAFGIYFISFDRLFAEITVRGLVVGLLVILAAGWAVTLARALASQT